MKLSGCFKNENLINICYIKKISIENNFPKN